MLKCRFIQFSLCAFVDNHIENESPGLLIVTKKVLHSNAHPLRLDSMDECRGHATRQEWVFAVVFEIASPAGMANQIMPGPNKTETEFARHSLAKTRPTRSNSDGSQLQAKHDAVGKQVAWMRPDRRSVTHSSCCFRKP